ncbi:MAG: hypothetical protein KBD31_05170 [Proteobacteria bacterium]|nr:hypothetical protein [Pseudomonadota bacterium]
MINTFLKFCFLCACIFGRQIFATDTLEAVNSNHQIQETVLPEIIDLSKLTQTKCDNLDPELYKVGALAFNEAPEILSVVHYLKNRFGINTAIETGIFEGCTTIALSQSFQCVFGVEINPEFILKTKTNISHAGSSLSNIIFKEGSSPVVLSQLLPELKDEFLFFYLDSHWNEYWPILDELKVIAQTHKDRCVIMIDDFLVPGYPEIRACQYKGQVLSKDYIAEFIKSIFTNPQLHFVVPKHRLHKGKAIVFPGGL